MKIMSVIKKSILTMTLAASLFTYPLAAFAYGDDSASENSTDSHSTSASNKDNNGDTKPPSINAAINNGKLRVRAVDEAGIKVIYVNDYEFLDPEDGILSIRLEKFEAGIEYFTISAMDNNGNKSQDYKLKNPYWTDPNADDDNSDNPAEELPADASATEPGDATGEVTDHVKTDENGYIIEEDDMYYTGANDPAFGREFYTIETATGKVFYLIIDRDDDNETVHFVTDITENDLLNATSGNSEVLPKNSIASDSSIPVSEIAIPADNGGTITIDAQGNKTVTDKDGNVVEQEEEEQPAETVSENGSETTKKKINPLFLYIGIGAVVVAVGYYLKVVKPKKSKDFVEDEEAEEAREEELAADDDVLEDNPGTVYSREQGDTDFFNDVVDDNDGGEA